MSVINFSFVKADLTPVFSPFSYKPINYSVIGSQIINKDVITSSYSPAIFSLPDNSYKVQCNLESNNDWYIATANDAYTVINSGSVITASLCTVNFSFLNNDNTPSIGSLVSISPINSNVIYTNAGTSSFVLGDVINNYTDAYGDLIVSLLPQLYSVTLKGKFRDTEFNIFPTADGNVTDFIIA